MPLSQSAVNSIDWTVVGICGALFCCSVLGALYTALYSGSPKRPAANEFNQLWRARFFSQVLAALYSLSQLLRLQVLWGPASVISEGGYHAIVFCRAFTALAFGLFEPLFLLLALFAFIYSLQGSPVEHPNTSIVIFALGFSLPACVAQLVCALFTRIFDLDYGTSWTLRMFFSTYDARQTGYCPAEIVYNGSPDVATGGLMPPLSAMAAPTVSKHAPPPPGSAAWSLNYDSNCAFCVFPMLSTLISVTFEACALLMMWIVTQRVVRAAINKTLIRRVRMLQLLVTLFVVGGLICRGITVVFEPFEVGFEVLRLIYVLCVAGLVLTVSFVLVLKPIHDSRVADKQIRKALQQMEQQPSFFHNPLRAITDGQSSSDVVDAEAPAPDGSGLSITGSPPQGGIAVQHSVGSTASARSYDALQPTQLSAAVRSSHMH